MSSKAHSEVGHIYNLTEYISRLMRSTNEYAFLIVTVAHSDDFMQLTGDASGVHLDFPLITPRQRSLEEKIRAVCVKEGLAIEENWGSDGARFIDIYINGDAHGVAASCSKIMRGVFSVSGTSELVYEHQGLADGGDT